MHDPVMDREFWNARYAAKSELLWTGAANRTLVAEVSDLTPGRALDVACGEGRNAVWLAEQGWQVTGIDFSDAALAKAARLAAERGVEAEWVDADVLEYAPDRESFDLVVVLYLHLLPEKRRAVLARMADAVAPGGLILIVGHDTTNIEEGTGGPQNPSILFTAEEVAAELPGLRIERAERIRRTVSTPDGEKQALDALVRATRDRATMGA